MYICTKILKAMNRDYSRQVQVRTGERYKLVKDYGKHVTLQNKKRMIYVTKEQLKRNFKSV